MKLDKSIFIQSILLILFLASCGPSHKVTFSWKNENFNIEKPYKKIFLAALITNPHVRTHLEEEMSKAAIEKGFIVERSWDYFPPTFSKGKPLDKEMMIDKIKELKCDLIFTITLIDKQSETRYIPGMSAFHGPYPGYGLRFTGFYSYWYPYLYDPGYYVTDKTYFMEGNLFDGATETMIWSVQTETLNPSSIEKFSKDIVTLMLEKSLQELQYKVQK
jgi:hypothetical protein